MKRFSDRIGVTSPPKTLQVDGMDIALRNSLWNVVLKSVFSNRDDKYHAAPMVVICERFFKYPVDSLPVYFKCKDWLKNEFFSKTLPWYGAYNLLEFIAQHASEVLSTVRSDGFVAAVNVVLEREHSGYRFIGGVLSPITNASEMDAISEAMRSAETHGLLGAHTHIATAVSALSRKPKPDFRNSVKESISAIESVAKVLSGESSGGLARALSALEKKVPLHGALKTGLLSLYGYTSDKDGIRHAILEGSDVGFEEAKFMLVTCSAAANFLIAKADASGLIDLRGGSPSM